MLYKVVSLTANMLRGVWMHTIQLRIKDWFDSSVVTKTGSLMDKTGVSDFAVRLSSSFRFDP